MMHEVQRDVLDFHDALNIPIGTTPAIRRPELRADLIMEEAIETCEATTGRRILWRYEDDLEDTMRISGKVAQRSLVEAIDGMCDLLCVVYGTAIEFGVDLAPFWDEVHCTNMAKANGPVRADGKVLKPPGWAPPDIAGLLARVAT